MKQFNIAFPREVCCHCFINKYKRRDNLFVSYLAKMNEFEKKIAIIVNSLVNQIYSVYLINILSQYLYINNKMMLTILMK